YEVDILTRRFEGQRNWEHVAPRVRLLRFPCGGDGFIPKETLCQAIPEWAAHALAHFDERGLEYVLVNSHYWDAGLAGCARAAELGIPHVHTPHAIGAWKRDNMDGNPADLERRYNFRRRIRDEK